MRLRGQRVPQALLAALGRLNFVFFAPVCLFPSCRPQDSLLIRVARPLSAPLRPIVWRAAHLDEVGSGAVSNNNSTSSWTPPVVVAKLLAEPCGAAPSPANP